MRVENPLSQFSIDAQSEHRHLQGLEKETALRKIEQNFLAYENEVLRDEPVSIRYSYWFGKDDQLYTDPLRTEENRAISQFDPREREGMFIDGFLKTTNLLAQNPGKVVLWYSPAGSAAFHQTPSNPYSDIVFKYGQLYFQHFDGDTVQAVAIKVTENEILDELMPTVSAFSRNLQSEQSQTRFLLSHPVATNWSVDDFLEKNWTDTDVYKDKEGTVHAWRSILQKIKTSLTRAEKSETTQAVLRTLARSDLSEKSIFDSYMQLINYEMQKTGRNYIQLAGSCGGKTVTKDSILSLLGLESPLANLFSSGLRSLSAQTESLHHPDYECPHCHKMLSGESRTNSSSWRKSCDHCGGSLGC